MIDKKSVLIAAIKCTCINLHMNKENIDYNCITMFNFAHIKKFC